MKLILLTFCLLWAVSCSRVSPDGGGESSYRQFTIYSDGESQLIARGGVEKGQPQGSWFIVDNFGVKNAELNFKFGTYNGSYILYYTSYTPDAAGDLKTKGNTSFGSFDGNYIRYNPDSSILVQYTAQGGKVDSVISGGQTDAEQQLRADISLLKAYREAILEALR